MRTKSLLSVAGGSTSRPPFTFNDSELLLLQVCYFRFGHDAIGKLLAVRHQAEFGLEWTFGALTRSGSTMTFALNAA